MLRTLEEFARLVSFLLSRFPQKYILVLGARDYVLAVRAAGGGERCGVSEAWEDGNGGEERAWKEERRAATNLSVALTWNSLLV